MNFKNKNNVGNTTFIIIIENNIPFIIQINDNGNNNYNMLKYQHGFSEY